MRLTRAVLLALPAVALAHGPGGHHHFVRHHNKRQTTPGQTTTPGHSTTPAAPAPPASGTTTTTPVAGHTPPTTPGASTPSPSAPVASSPGAVPLDQIVPNAAVSDKPVVPVPTLPAGSKPSGIPNAPAVPSLGNWFAQHQSYPPSDKAPPTDSAEVKQWIEDVRNSGVVIPDIKPFTYGDAMCQIPENQARVGNQTECWWTCGHCERESDITTCKNKMTWGSSFDDGPAPHTPELLNYLTKNNLKTTFFVVGSRVKDRPEYLQTQYLQGHQIGVHTWSHTSLTTQSTEAIIAEFGWTKKIIKDALGVTPYYMRPPYGDIDDRVRAIARAMDLIPVIWTVGDGVSFDTFDWQVPGGEQTALASVGQFQTILTHAANLATGFIVLEHDLFWQEVDLATGYFLPSALAAHFRIVSINECMSTNIADMYLETSATKKIPAGSGSGGKVTASDQVATPDTPLGGSDGSADKPPVTGGSGSGNDSDTNPGSGAQALTLRDGVASMLLATLFAGAWAAASAL